MTMAATSPNPSNLLLLAAIGIGAYWFLTRSTAAQPVVVTQPAPDPTAQRLSAGAGLVRAIGGLVSGWGGAATVPNYSGSSGGMAAYPDYGSTTGGNGAWL